MSEERDPKRLMAEALKVLQRTQARLHALEEAQHEPIAIIGAGCRLPNRCNDRHRLWEALLKGEDFMGPVPKDRWDTEHFYDQDPSTPGRMNMHTGGFIETPEAFDAKAFGMSPREAVHVDPQQRVLLEVTWEALEDAQLRANDLHGTSVGVFMGISTVDYVSHLVEHLPRDQISAFQGTGISHSSASGRISFALGLIGPSLALNTACSSSLVAIHLACESLRRGECEAALVGGVNLMLQPFSSVVFSQARMLAKDGRCKPFSAQADGYGRSEGAAVLVLKPLRQALADGDHILAEIVGSAVNQDGPSGGLTVPNGPMQEAVIAQALKAARIEPKNVGHIEAHGTGTSLGDPLEMRALGKVFGNSHNAAHPLSVSSIKSNLGHLEAAAGAAGILKVALELKHHTLVPHLHAEDRSPHIPWSELPVSIPKTPTPWHERRVAGVSSFGFTGTNVHVVLRAAAESAKPSEASAESPVSQTDEESSSVALCWSAHSEPALRAYASRLAETIEHQGQGSSLAEIATALAKGRTSLSERASLVANDPIEAAQQLRAFALTDESSFVRSSTTRPRIDGRLLFVLTDDGKDPLPRWKKLLAHSDFARRLESILPSSSNRDPAAARRLCLLTLAERATSDFGPAAKIAIDAASAPESDDDLDAVRKCLCGGITVKDLLRSNEADTSFPFLNSPWPLPISQEDPTAELSMIAIGFASSESGEAPSASVHALNPAHSYAFAHARQVADAHLSGLDIRSCFVALQTSRRTDLPHYQWQHQHYFVQPNPTVAHANGSSDHPLLGDLIQNTETTTKWTSSWRAGGHPPQWMRMVSNRDVKVLPEGVLIEILLETARRLTKSESFTCSDIHLRPQAWHPTLELQVKVAWNGKPSFQIEVFGRRESAQWQVICAATVKAATPSVAVQPSAATSTNHEHDIAGLWECEDRAGRLVSEPARALISAQGVRSQACTGEFRLRLSDKWDLESSSYSMHPLLWQSMLAALGAYEEVQGLSTLRIDCIEWNGRLGRAARVEVLAPYLCMKPALLWFSEEAVPVARMTGLQLCPSSALPTPYGAFCGPPVASMKTVWEPSQYYPHSEKGERRDERGGIYLAVTPDASPGVTGQLSALVADGLSIKLCSPKELSSASDGHVVGILDLRHLHSSVEAELVASDLEREIAYSIHLANYASQQGLPWILITSGAVNAVTKPNARPNPVMAGVAAFHRSWMSEESALSSFQIDFADAEEELGESLLQAMAQLPWEREFWVQDGGLTVPRLDYSTMASLQDDSARSPMKEDNWLITGGMGGLGLAVAEGLAAAGAQNIILVSRSGAQEAQHQTLKRLTKLYSTSFMVRLVDVTLENSVCSLARDLKAEDLELHGIIHAAGVIDDQLVTHLDADSVRNVLGPKVTGTLNLRGSFPDAKMVVFTSMSALLGNPGQAAYAAGNAFADAYASALVRSSNQPNKASTRTIQWGPWAGLGMASAVPERAKAAMNERGILHMDPGDAVNWLVRALKEGREFGGAVAALDLERYRRSVPTRGEIPRLRSLAGPSVVMQRRLENSAQEHSLSEGLKACTPKERGPFLLDAMRTAIASILRVAPDELSAQTPVIELGLDSLMGVELRNRVRAELDLDLPLAPLLQGASLENVSQLLVEQLAESENRRREEADLIEEIEGLTPEEVERLLRDDG